MKAVAVAAGKRLETVEVEPPPLGPDEVRVDVAYAGICGSDLHMLQRDGTAVGHVMGHEFSGSIAEVGSPTAQWSVGDRVTVLPIDRCGHCASCEEGIGVCRAGLSKGPGLGRMGAYAESTVVPVSMLRRLPDSVDFKAAALAEPLAVAVRGVRRSGASPDTPVCVLGAGPIGYMTVVALLAGGFTDIVVVEPNDARREKVSDLGVPAVPADAAADDVPAGLGGRPPALVIDCSGHRSGVPLAVTLLPQNGTLVVVGIALEPTTAPFALISGKELTVKGSLAYSDSDFEIALKYLAAQRVPTSKIVTAIRPLAEASAVFDDLTSGTSHHVKVLLSPRA